MKQVVQNIRTGATYVADAPAPIKNEGEVIVAILASVISSGTERYVVELSQKSLLQKAKDRPDHVKRVLQKIKNEGLRSTLRQVQEKLDEPMAMGYSAAGVVLDCGAGIRHVRPGDRVAVAGPHAEVLALGANQCARIPDNVSFADAAYASISAIALQGVRLARVSLGESVVVVGLGLIGLISIALLKAQGCRVFGIDIDASRLDKAREFGADEVAVGAPASAVAQFTRRQGADAVVLCTATASNEPIEFAAEVTRPKGRVVLVGVAGLNIPRPPFFQKEIEFCVSSSMGPGRGDPAYEKKGIDYPIGYARWTMQRNIEAVLDQIAAARLPVARLTSHTFAIDQASAAYELLVKKNEPYLGIVLTYPEPDREVSRRKTLSVRASTGDKLRVSVVGAGNYGRLVTLPALAKEQAIAFRGICSAKGLSAAHAGERYQFEYATSDYDEILRDKNTDAIFVLTRHDLHARETEAALRAGKHVFVQKPLCIAPGELLSLSELPDSVREGRLLMVGFNRRFSKSIATVRDHFGGAAPITVHYRFSSADLAPDTWPQDFEIGGGRLIGEACHAIDACIALAGSPAIRVFCECVSPVGDVRTPDDRAFITMRHANGSVSSVSYQAGGDPAATPKERFEVFGGGKTAMVEAFNRIELWSGGQRTTAQGSQDMGQEALISAFVHSCRSGGAWPVPWDHVYSSAWAPLAALQSLKTGHPVDVDTPLE
ncbi:MAG: bi-domain-containing oxidoreductase [Cyanobacteria bacterium]|nr:bi-domain-containing oxidoreductase [Cyanobacteriota bacterium]